MCMEMALLSLVAVFQKASSRLWYNLRTTRLWNFVFTLVGYVVKGINSHLMFLLQTYNRGKFAPKQHSKYTTSVDIKIHTHTHTHTHTHARTHAHTHCDCSRNWVLILVGMKILWKEEGFQFGFIRRRRRKEKKREATIARTHSARHLLLTSLDSKC